jgi:hypothetical protein
MIHSLSKALFWQVDGPERHQVQLINVILVLMTAYFAVIGTINVLVDHRVTAGSFFSAWA